jgi:diguanylate cyclase (GGDEF)-like protein
VSHSAELDSNPADASRAAAPAIVSEILDPLCETLESGILMLGHDERIVVCSLAMSGLLGRGKKDLLGMAVPELNTLVLGLMDDPPKLLLEKGLFPTTCAMLCEEFELARPSHTFVRWIARRAACRYYCAVAVATDITADVVLTNAYERMALTDRLTGLANRRRAEGQVQQELLRLKRYQTPVSLVLFDLDHFKHINDTYGHSAGDEVLRQVAKAMADSVRDTDLVARWGGEEFLLVLPETPHSGALNCAERTRAKVESLGERLGFPVTISGGVYQPAPGDSAADLINRADARLYEAKRTGRNRIC